MVKPYGGTDYQASADRPKPSPVSPPKAKYRPSEIKTWAKFVDLELKDERGATSTEWRDATCKNGAMSATAFKEAQATLRKDGWVISRSDTGERGARYRPTHPGADAEGTGAEHDPA